MKLCSVCTLFGFVLHGIFQRQFAWKHVTLEFLVTNNFCGGKLLFRIHVYIAKYSGRHVAHIVIHLLYVLVYNIIKLETQPEGLPPPPL